MENGVLLKKTGENVLTPLNSSPNLFEWRKYSNCPDHFLVDASSQILIYLHCCSKIVGIRRWERRVRSTKVP